MKSVRDEHGFNPSMMVGALIGVLIAVIIGFALFSALLSSVDAVNDVVDYPAGSPILTIVNLAPLLFALGVTIAAVAVVFVGLRLGLPGGGGGT